MNKDRFERGAAVCCYRGTPREFKAIVKRHVSLPTTDGYWLRVAAPDLSSIQDVFVPAGHVDRIRPSDWHE